MFYTDSMAELPEMNRILMEEQARLERYPESTLTIITKLQ